MSAGLLFSIRVFLPRHHDEEDHEEDHSHPIEIATEIRNHKKEAAADFSECGFSCGALRFWPMGLELRIYLCVSTLDSKHYRHVAYRATWYPLRIPLI